MTFAHLALYLLLTTAALIGFGLGLSIGLFN